jgi:glutathione S-transferase
MERFVAVQMFKREPDEALVRRCLEEQQPPLFDLLEARVGGRAFAVGERLSVADIALAAPFVSLRHVAAELDARRWPGLASYLEGIWARPSFKALLEEEAASTDH